LYFRNDAADEAVLSVFNLNGQLLEKIRTNSDRFEINGKVKVLACISTSSIAKPPENGYRGGLSSNKTVCVGVCLCTGTGRNSPASGFLWRLHEDFVKTLQP